MSRTAERDSGEPAGYTGTSEGAEIPNSSWKSLRMTVASVKSSMPPAIWGWVAYWRDAASAEAGSGTELRGRDGVVYA